MYEKVTKRILDALIALIALLVLWLPILVLGLIVKLDSKGPVLFWQKRVGRNKKTFMMPKFRTMYTETPANMPTHMLSDPSKWITRVGKVYRKLSIDELPQLFCMLTFKMSLIGYRPSQSNETELNQAREGYDMYQIQPGITGWAQVNGRDVLAAQPIKKAAFDAYYLEHFSLWLDIKIFFMTVVKVFKHDDVEEGVVNASAETEGSDAVNGTDADTNNGAQQEEEKQEEMV